MAASRLHRNTLQRRPTRPQLISPSRASKAVGHTGNQHTATTYKYGWSTLDCNGFLQVRLGSAVLRAAKQGGAVAVAGHILPAAAAKELRSRSQGGQSNLPLEVTGTPDACEIDNKGALAWDSKGK